MQHKPSMKTQVRKRDENLLFLRRWFKNPKALGSVVPSSVALAEFICKHVTLGEDDYVVEIGAGTGRFTKSLIQAGLPVDRIFLVELDPEMCRFLKQALPMVTVIEGDATNLENLLPAEILGKVSTVISGIPLINLSAEIQSAIAKACFSVLAESGSLLQFTYGPISPLSAKRLGLKKDRLGHVLLNFPPAIIWRYQRLGLQDIPKKKNAPFAKLLKFKRSLNFGKS